MTLPTDYPSQITYMQALVDRLNTLEAQNAVITITKVTEPKQADFVAAWLLAGKILPITSGYEFHWFDGIQLRGVYGALDEGFFMLKHGGANPSFSPLTTEEVLLYDDLYTNAPSVARGIFLANLGQLDERISIPGPTGSNTTPCFDSTAQNIVFGNSTSVPVFNIYKMTRAGASITVLTATGSNVQPHWRQNLIVFMSIRAPHATQEVYSMTPAGASQTRLTSAGGNSFLPHLSNDGTKIVYISDRGGSSQIWTMTAAGASQTNLGIAATFAIWSFDGTKIYFFQNRNIINNTGNAANAYLPGASRPVSEMYMCDANGTNIVQLTDYYGYGEPGESPVNLSKDATYVTPGKADMSAYFRESVFRTFDAPPDGRRFVVEEGPTVSYPISGVVSLANARKLAGSTGRVHRQISWDTPYGDIELLDSFTPNIATLLSWRTAAMANRPEMSHLLIVAYIKEVNVALDAANFLINFNDDANASNYVSYVDAYTGVTPSSNEFLAGTQAGILGIGVATTKNDVNVMGGAIMYVPDYNDPASFKTALGTGGDAFSYAVANQRQSALNMGIWTNVAPITSMTIKPSTAVPFQIGTNISVYGILGKGRYLEQ